MLMIIMFFKGFNGVLNYFDKWAITLSEYLLKMCSTSFAVSRHSLAVSRTSLAVSGYSLAVSHSSYHVTALTGSDDSTYK